jgi:L-seryl-tRNA(Ser) seleniumtransferase
VAKILPSEVNALLRRLPAVDELLAEPSVRDRLAAAPRWAVLEAIRDTLADRRRRLLDAGPGPAGEALAATPAIVAAALERLADRELPSLRPVLNATGVVIHTNLGRAPLGRAPLEAIREAARGYSTLEFDLARGARGSRQAHVEQLLTALTEAEAALVVNNNAAAVFLAVNTLAREREVVVSRGELVEIGDAFRIPDVMTSAGGRLREVGTTNRTHLRDYERALGPETGLVLKVHPSNFRIQGFTAEVAIADLAALAAARGLPMMADLGSGALLDLTALGLPREPVVAEAIRAGADLVSFSGDKLLGGPQAGVLVGRKALIARIRRNPLARTVRIDKLCLAGLEATLRLLREPERARTEIPVLRMLTLPAPEIGRRAELLAAALQAAAPGLRSAVEDGVSEVGGGALPLETLPTRLLVLEPAAGPADLERRLRRGRPAVLVRIKEDRVLLDLRTVEPAEDSLLARALLAALGAEAAR